MKRILVLAAVAVLAFTACGGGGGDNGGGDVDDDVCGGATLGCLTGVVQAASGAALGDAQVTYKTVAAAAQMVGKSATDLTTTNAQGWFSATGLPQGENVVCFSKDGYVKKCRTVTITAKKGTPLPPTKLAARGTAVTIANVEGGGTANEPTGTAGQIIFPANSVCDSSGTPVTGDIQCYLTPIDVTSNDALETVPDTFVAISAAGARGTMVSDAMMEITCEKSGAEVNICDGETATVRLPIYSDNCADTQSDAGWYFDETAGVWQEYDTGAFNKTCVADEADSYFEFDVDHLTWVNGDIWVDDACLTGFVYLSVDEQPTSSFVTVSCWGSGWRNEVQVNSNGRFCVPVPVSRAYTCKVGDSSRWIDATKYITGTAPATVVEFPIDSCPATGCFETTGFIFASPILTTTLTWGLAPRDLDSHTINNEGTVHVWYGDKDLDLTKGSLVAAPYIALDTDDVDSYGPEVTTVMPSVADGKYCFGVHNYSGESNMADTSTDINGNPKRATVTVTGEGIAKTFTIPSSNPDNHMGWRVYTVEFSGGRVVSGSFKEANDLVSDVPTDCNW